VIAYRHDPDGRPSVVATNAAFDARFGTVRPNDPLDAALQAVVDDSGDASRGLRTRIDEGGLDTTVTVTRSGAAGRDTGEDRDGASVPEPSDQQTYRVRSVPVVSRGRDADDRSGGTDADATAAVDTAVGSADAVDGYLVFTPLDGHDAVGAGHGERVDDAALLAAVVSHDIQNPLEVARIRLDAAEETGDSRHFEKVRDAHDRIRRLTRDVLFVAEGPRSVDRTPVELEDAVAEAWMPVGAETPTATLRTDDLPAILADPAYLRRLLENLFANAVDHGGPDVTVRVTRLPDGFAVVDDGPGIPPADRARVFEPRETLDGGTGLGLAVVDRVAAAHGWEVAAVDPADDGDGDRDGNGDSTSAGDGAGAGAGDSDGGGARVEVTGVRRVDDGPEATGNAEPGHDDRTDDHEHRGGTGEVDGRDGYSPP
jgi:hypothetical protein